MIQSGALLVSSSISTSNHIMATLTTLHLPHLPETLVIHVALYGSVLNAQNLHTQLLQGSPEFEYALIDATSVISPFFLSTNYLLDSLQEAKQIPKRNFVLDRRLLAHGIEIGIHTDLKIDNIHTPRPSSHLPGQQRFSQPQTQEPKRTFGDCVFIREHKQCEPMFSFLADYIQQGFSPVFLLLFILLSQI